MESRYQDEITVEYDPVEHNLYRRGDPRCAYHQVRWPFTAGRAKYGEFPLVVVREHYRRMGYVVLASEPRLSNEEGFILLSYPGKRRAGDPAYRRMETIFGADVLQELNKLSDAAKRRETGNAGGGDPDLFVFSPTDPQNRFFVEVKHRDRLLLKQYVTFPLIRSICPVVVVRLRPAGVAVAQLC